jgi:MYXO-CTERM domain-containing protein
MARHTAWFGIKAGLHLLRVSPLAACSRFARLSPLLEVSMLPTSFASRLRPGSSSAPLASTASRKSRALGRLLASTLASAVMLAPLAAHAAAHAEAPANPSLLVMRAGHMRVMPRATAAIPVGARTPEFAARAAIASYVQDASKFALRKSTEDHFGDGDDVVHFTSWHKGVPVFGADVVVRVARDGSPRVVIDELAHELVDEHVSATPRFLAADAARVTTERTGLRVGADEAHLVFVRAHGQVHLAWLFAPKTPSYLPLRLRVLISAEDGSVLELRNLVQFAKASMYETNPTKSPNLALRAMPIDPVASTLDNPFFRTINCVDRKSVKSINVGIPINVHTCDAVQTAAPNAEGDFVYTPNDMPGAPEAAEDPFSEVSMYYHVGRAYAFFRGLQGSADAQVVSDKPLPAMANLRIPQGFNTFDLAKLQDPNLPLVPFSNAFFTPPGDGQGGLFADIFDIPGGAILFGQGPRRDYAYDGDVVYHEFGHAVVDRTLRLGAYTVDSFGTTAAPGAMNEGLADYFAAALAGDPDVGEYASQDIDQNLSVIRSLSNQDTCAKNILGEVHVDSTLFSGAMWEARTKLAEGDRSKFDAAIYKAMRTSPNKPDLTYDGLATLFINLLKTDLPAGAAALEAAMTGRGVLPKCTRVIEVEQGPASAPKYGGRSIGFNAPGKQAIGSTTVAPGIVQVTRKLPAGTVKVKVSVKLGAAGASQNPLGGGGKPFTPSLLVKWDAPIAWSSGRRYTADTAETRDLTAGQTATTELDVPEGSTAVYVQIANGGDSDGNYDDIAIEAVAAEAPAAPPPAAAPEQLATAGCGCQGSGNGASSGLSAVVPGLALVGLGLLARRRARRAA